MKKNSIFFSVMFATVGFLCCLLNYSIIADTPSGCIIWTAEVFAVTLTMGYIGLEFSLFLKRKEFTVSGRRNIILCVLMSVLLGAVTGAVGQTLFALETEKYLKEPKNNIKNTSMVFMMDNSLSMEYYYRNCIEASCELLDILDESCKYKYLAFSYSVNYRSDFLELTDENKEKIKDFARSTNVTANITSFVEVLEEAYDTLTNQTKGSDEKIAILFSDCISTDGYSFISDELINLYNASNIKLYIIMISEDPNAELAENDPLAKIAYEIFNVTPQPGDQIDVSEFSEVLRNAASGITREDRYGTKLVLGEEMLLYSGETSVVEMLIRIIVFSVYAAIAGFIYYGFENKKRIFVNSVTGVLAGGLSIIHPIIGIVALILFSLTAFTDFIIEKQELV